MTPQQFEGIYKRLHAAYPHDFRLDDESVHGLWESMFCHHDAQTVMAAVNSWLKDHRRAPAIADVNEGIRAAKRQMDAPKVERLCGSCDNGWVWTQLAGRGTVAACPNGCRPSLPSTYETPVHARPTNPVDAIEEARQNLAYAAARRKDPRAYIVERGYDPDKFRVVEGVILANPPVPVKKRSSNARPVDGRTGP